MNIFYFGADNSWTELLDIGFRRRNTCILNALAENPTVDNIYVVKKSTRVKLFKQLFSSSRREGKVHDLVFADIFPNRLLKFLNISALNAAISGFFLRLSVGARLEDALLWAYWPKGFLTLKESGLKGRIIFDADHNIIDDPNIPDEKRSERKRLLMEIGNQAAYILSASVSMINWFNKLGYSNTVRVRNGVDLKRFEAVSKGLRKGPLSIVYCGTLSRWIDYDIFQSLIRNHPDWQFTIIGQPYLTGDWQALNTLTNLKMLGEKSADEVAALLPTFDVGISLYRTHPALDADSMKLYEYLAAGLPVVSTEFHSGLQHDFNGLLHLGNDSETIERHLANLSVSKEVGEDSSVGEFLRSATWYKRVDDFLEKME